jgi:hypothetical protein
VLERECESLEIELRISRTGRNMWVSGVDVLGGTVFDVMFGG